MASPTLKVKKIRKAKEYGGGRRRKREIRRDLRRKLADIAQRIGLAAPDQLAGPADSK